VRYCSSNSRIELFLLELKKHKIHPNLNKLEKISTITRIFSQTENYKSRQNMHVDSGTRHLAKNTRVVVGLSGGVDSAVAAKKLVDHGLDVVAVFMKNWDEDDDSEFCSAEEDYRDAQSVADHLGIDLLQANFADEYWERVFEEFLDGYRCGNTPNPDVLCNKEIKFDLFIRLAETLGAEYIATGHYAARTSEKNFQLHKGIDETKDQSYFLQAVPRKMLSRCIFPLALSQKNDVRSEAKTYGFSNYGKRDSTGICFIGERNFENFLAQYIKRSPGPIVDTTTGIIIGKHRGLSYYTLGQRSGLQIGGLPDKPELPWYVLEKNSNDNALIVTQDQKDLYSFSLTAKEPNWLCDHVPKNCFAKIRYRQPDQACSVISRDNRIFVTFEHAQRAITPGQYIALYDGTRCLGGAKITEAS